MDAAVKNLIVRFIADTKDAKGNISQLLDSFGGFGKIASLVGVVTTAVLGLRHIATSTFQAGIFTEDSITQLTVLLKDANAARDMYQKAFQFSVETPFEPDEVVAASIIAKSYLGDMGDAFSKNLFGLKNDVITLIGDMASFSKQTMQEAATALLRGDLQLLDKYGSAGRKAYMTAKSAGPLGSEAFIKSFVAEMGKVDSWMGMAEKRGRTMSGLMSTLSGNISSMSTFLSGAAENEGTITLWSELKAIMRDIVAYSDTFIKFMKPLLIELGGAIGSTFRFVWELLKPILGALWELFQPLLKILQIVFQLVRAVFSLGTQMLRGILGVIESLFEKLGFLDKFIASGKEILDFFETTILNINMMFAFLTDGFNSMIDSIKNFLNEYIPKLLIKMESLWLKLKAYTGFASPEEETRIGRVNQYMNYVENLKSGTPKQKELAYTLLQRPEYKKLTEEFRFSETIERFREQNVQNKQTYNQTNVINYNVNSIQDTKDLTTTVRRMKPQTQGN